MKKKAGAIIAVWTITCILTGCRETAELPIVVQKKSAIEARTIEPETGMKIQDQVQVSEKYQAEITDKQGMLKVKIDADFVIPEAEGFKLKKVEPRMFTQEDVDKQVNVLLKDNPITRAIYDETDPAGGWTRPLLEEQIESLRAQEEAGASSADEYGEDYDIGVQMAQLEELYRIAPETMETEEVEPTIGYEPMESQVAAGDDSINVLEGDITIDGESYHYYTGNTWSDSWKWITNRLRRSGSIYAEIFGDQDERNELPLLLTPEEVREKGNELIKALDFDYMQVGGEEYCATSLAEATDFTSEEPTKGYGLHYTRMVDGIPITYTAEFGGNIDHDENGNPLASWPYESLTIIYDDKGLAEFCWENPYIISDISEDNVFLLPFDEIRTIFEQMIITKNSDAAEYIMNAQFDIYEVRLGYGRIMEKGKAGEGTLIPVWDFFGTQTYTYPEEILEDGTKIQPEDSTHDFPYLSLMTINAMDGTVIDRGFGY